MELELQKMKFEEALKCMREGKKVKSSSVISPIFIADYTNGFGETYKAICWKDGEDIFYYTVEHNDIFTEDWEVVDE
jgi:hypothetical protein